jgi:RNA polymerase sigma-70 factor, ECF subfamily
VSGQTLMGRSAHPLVAALRRGDNRAFAAIVDEHESWMLRAARGWVGSHAVAEEVVQETWIAALRALDRFEGRSALRTWLFSILTNAARRHAAREDRSSSFSDLARREAEAEESDPLVDRFFAGSHPRWPNCWTTIVTGWDTLPEERILADETRRTIEAELDRLSAPQRLIFSLRDLEGWSAPEVCASLGVSGANQRVLLHRARLRIRAALERYFEEPEC